MKPKSDLHMLLYMKRIEQKRIAEVLGRTQQCISLWLKNPTVKQRELIINAILQIEKERNSEDYIYNQIRIKEGQIQTLQAEIIELKRSIQI